MRVLFVCRVNAGRSQAAMEYFNQLMPGCAESAGTLVESQGQKVGLVYGKASLIQALKEDGINLLKNTRTQLNESMIKVFDKVIVMAEPYTFPKYLKIGGKVEYWPIKDPRYGAI